jgi:hypothetical protein
LKAACIAQKVSGPCPERPAATRGEGRPPCTDSDDGSRA